MNLNLIRTVEPKIGRSDIYLSASGDNLPLVLDNLSQNIDFEDSLNEAMKSILPKTRRLKPLRSVSLFSGQQLQPISVQSHRMPDRSKIIRVLGRQINRCHLIGFNFFTRRIAIFSASNNSISRGRFHLV